MLLGHGSQIDADSSASTHLQVERIRRLGVFDEVLAAFWKEEPNVCHTLDLVQSEDVFVVPHFISNGYFTEQILPRELEIDGRVTVRGKRRIFYGEPVGTHPSMTHALRHCAERLLRDGPGPRPPPADVTLILVGHGTLQNENSAQAVLDHVKGLQQDGAFAEVLPAFLEQAPFDREVLARVRTPWVVAIPFFISDGFHSRRQIPVNLGFVKPGQSWRNPVRRPCPGKNPRLRGLWYAQAIGSEPGMTEVILARVAEMTPDASRHPARPLQSHEICGPKRLPRLSSHEMEFITEIRRRGEIEFGDLLLRASGARFSARHRADRATTERRLKKTATVQVIPAKAGIHETEDGTEATDARALGLFTQSGEYRPLRFAPTLRNGWIFRTGSRAALVLFVNLVYPAAIAHRAMAGHGLLRVRSFDEVAGRQSGRYAPIRRLAAAAVRAAARRLCGEGRCWKHPLWPVHTRDAEPVIRKSGRSLPGAIPCPEPCSHWIAMANDRQQDEHDKAAQTARRKAGGQLRGTA